MSVCRGCEIPVICDGRTGGKISKVDIFNRGSSTGVICFTVQAKQQANSTFGPSYFRGCLFSFHDSEL